jgi:hypothetical protein
VLVDQTSFALWKERVGTSLYGRDVFWGDDEEGITNL